MAPFYQDTPQRDNIAAAIDLPRLEPDDMNPADLVIFQREKKVEQSDVRPGESPWEEVSQLHAFIRDMLTTLI